MMHYTLDDNNNAVPCSLEEWGKLYRDEGNERRRVADDHVNEYQISTVFLGLDHNYYEGEPHLFETMIFGDGIGDGYQTRCSTWEQEVEMHKVAIQWVKDGCKDD